MAVTRKEILISEASLGYLQSDEMSEAFCGQCPWSESRQGEELKMTKIINTTLKNVCFAGGKGEFVGDA